MQYTERLDWILDKVRGRGMPDNEKIRRNIDFVHSLGLKCDCVGWCKLDLADPKAWEILDRIGEFCRSDGWKARCIYTREYQETESDWLELKTVPFREQTMSGSGESVQAENGKCWEYQPIRAYQESGAGPKDWDHICVPERFRDACLKHGLAAESEFFWIRDVGKYEAEQYFALLPRQRLSRAAAAFSANQKPKLHAHAVGGHFPQVAQVFHEIQMLDLPVVYFREDMPERGMVSVDYRAAKDSAYSIRRVLIHRDMAEILLREKGITPAQLKPALVLDQIHSGYQELKLKPQPRPLAAHLEKSLREYEAFKTKPRPRRAVSEKDALTQLRRAKRDRNEDFEKPLSKAKAEALESTPYGALIAYYRIANGGNLDEEGEYRWLPHAEALEENGAFQADLAAEETLEAKPNGVVFAKCADGDAVLLCGDGTVIRFSHEEPAAIAQWPSLAQFLFEALSQ